MGMPQNQRQAAETTRGRNSLAHEAKRCKKYVQGKSPVSRCFQLVAEQEGGPDAAGPSPFDSSSGFGKGGAKGPGVGAW